jgi:hypothetical protein
MVKILNVPPPAPAAFTTEAMAAALEHARMLAQMLYAATELLPGDAILTARAAEALARINEELAIVQRSETLAGAARAAGHVA